MYVCVGACVYLNSTPTSSGSRAYDPSLKIQVKLYHSSKYLTFSVILCFKRDRSRLKRDYCCHIWVRVAECSLFSISRIQKRPCEWWTIFHPPTLLSQTRCGKPLSALSTKIVILYFHKSNIRPKMEHYCRLCKWWNIFHPTISFSETKPRKPINARSIFLWEVFRWTTLLLPVQTFTAKTRHTTPIIANHPPPLRISSVRCKFHSSCLFPVLSTQLLRVWSIDYYNFDLLNSSALPTYPHNMCLLLYSPLTRVALAQDNIYITCNITRRHSLL